MIDIMPSANPLLSRLRMPGATFRLPSQGIFYTTELTPDVVNGEVEVYPMTAMEEIILNTPDKLLSGKAILEVFSRCIPQIASPNDLLTKDVDFLMVCLRMVSFGDTMDVTYQHTCDNAKEHEYTVDLGKMIRATKQIDPTTIKSEYSHTLPNGQVASLKPLTYKNAVELYQTTALSKTEDLSAAEAEQLIIGTLASVIKDVDGIVDRDQIKEWVQTLPLGWKKTLERAAQSVSQWGIDFTTDQKCKDCATGMKIQVTANPVSFFT